MSIPPVRICCEGSPDPRILDLVLRDLRNDRWPVGLASPEWLRQSVKRALRAHPDFDRDSNMIDCRQDALLTQLFGAVRVHMDERGFNELIVNRILHSSWLSL